MANLKVLSMSEKAYGLLPKQQEMSVLEWINIPDNPRQRDTERHLARAKHLMNPSPTHALVSMATDARGKSWKLDGHTRALGWKRGIIQAPKKVIVSIYPVSNVEEAVELYRHFDNQSATETQTDQVFGAWRELGWMPESKLLRRGQITNALRMAEGFVLGVMRQAKDITIYDLVRNWKPEIQRLDLISPHAERFIGGCVTAALLCYRRDGDDAIEFWRLYSIDGGEKCEGLIDPVESLTRYVQTLRASKKTAGSEPDVLSKSLAAYVAFHENRTYTNGIRGIDPVKFFGKKRS